MRVRPRICERFAPEGARQDLGRAPHLPRLQSDDRRWPRRVGLTDMAANGDWEWVPAPGWPPPPAGWVAPPGWQPDPSWPPAPPGHEWWRRPPRRSPRRRRWVILGLVCALVMGGCTLLAVVGGPCSFDPPPGDVSAVPVVNDSASAIVVGECHDQACRALDQHLRVAAH